MTWRDAVTAALVEIERHVDRFRPVDTGRRVVTLAPYRGFGRAREMLIRGRVLLEKQITRATEAEPVWQNVLNAYRRFQSDEMPGAKVRAAYGDSLVEAVSDEEGYFTVRLQPTVVEPDKLWHDVTLSVAETPVVTSGHVLIPRDDAEFGVISDIDDTIVITGATDLLQMMRSVLFENAATRLAFEGIAELYTALHRDRNPVFYVSSGPWNLYDLLTDFMELNRLPRGPMFLQDFGIADGTLIHAPHHLHKTREIQSLLDYYPHLPFVLVGDSGQHDPEIYLQVIRANPGRIRVAYIRDVTPEPRDRLVARIAEEAASAGAEMVYVADSAAAMSHARRIGLIGVTSHS